MSVSKQPTSLSTGKVKKAAAKAVTFSKASALSTEYVEDSRSDDESENEDVTTTLSGTEHSATPKTNGALPARPMTKGTTPLAAKSKPDATGTVDGAPSHSSSSSASGDDSDGSSESGEESGEESEEKTRCKSVAQKQTPKPGQISPKKSQLQPLYTPPPGFEPGSISLPSSAAANLLSPSSLKGKQIWHITVPASVPVDSIKEVSMQSVQKGEAALRYKGADYGFVIDRESQEVPKKLLIPDQRNSSYRPAAMPISQTLHLQQLVKLPNRGTTSGVPAEGIQSTASPSCGFRRAARPQPKGLKMRYLPLGDTEGQFGRMGPGSSTSGGSGDEDPQFRLPISVSSSGKTKKRKHNARDGPNDGPQSPEERQLKRSRSEADRAPEVQGPTETSPMEIDSQRDQGREGVRDSPSEATVADEARQKPAKKSSEDRAKRKEEKRRRKREKAGGVESKGESGRSDRSE